MTGGNEDLDTRRRKLVYRANHRGIKEMDILLGGYASARAGGMDHAALDEFETLMAESDRDLLTWFTGEAQIPARFDTPLFAAILAFAKDGTQTQ